MVHGREAETVLLGWPSCMVGTRIHVTSVWSYFFVYHVAKVVGDKYLELHGWVLLCSKFKLRLYGGMIDLAIACGCIVNAQTFTLCLVLPAEPLHRRSTDDDDDDGDGTLPFWS